MSLGPMEPFYIKLYTDPSNIIRHCTTLTTGNPNHLDSENGGVVCTSPGTNAPRVQYLFLLSIYVDPPSVSSIEVDRSWVCRVVVVVVGRGTD